MTDSAIKYVGVDGCKGGWIGIGLADDGCSKVEVCEDFSEMLKCFSDASLILVDTPIGLVEDGESCDRVCDKEARRKLRDRGSSVFPAPTMQLVRKVIERDWNYQDTNRWFKSEYNEVGITFQTFSLVRKIDNVCNALKCRAKDASPKVWEAHPEVCFLALSESLKGEQELARKQESLGFGQRLQIVSHCVGNVSDIFIKVPRYKGKGSPLVEPNDVLDALALAITAKIGSQKGNEFRTFPKDPQPDSVGEMVYTLLPKGTPC